MLSDGKSWIFLRKDFLLIMLLHIESKLFFRNCINGNTRAFLSLVIMTGVHIHFFRFSIVKSISGRYWEPTWPLTHSKIKCQFPNAILRNRQQQNKLLRDIKLNCIFSTAHRNVRAATTDEAWLSIRVSDPSPWAANPSRQWSDTG